MKEIALLFILMGPVAIIAQTLVITNGPMDTTVCTGSIVNISCGFVNDSANFLPNWRIIRRSNDGSVISNMTISGSDINNNVNDGLEYIPDTTSGLLMSPNSRLVVGPVDETDNQSSYQCIFALANGKVESSVGTLTVTGIPAVENLMAVDNCTSVTVSWDITDEGSCKDLSYNVSLISCDDGAILQSITTDDTSHTFTGVETSNKTFDVSVTARNRNATGLNRTETADVCVLPNVTNLTNTTFSEDTITVTWDVANSGGMYYMVMISSDEHSNIMNDLMTVTELTATFPNLMSDTSYTIAVTPYCRMIAGMTTTVIVRTSSPVPTQSNPTNPSNTPTPASSGGGSSNTTTIVIIVVIITIVCVAVIASCFATYLYIISDDGRNTLIKIPLWVTVFIVLSLGLGLIFITIYVHCGRKKGAMCKDVQPFEEEMDHHDKSSGNRTSTEQGKESAIVDTKDQQPWEYAVVSGNKTDKKDQKAKVDTKDQQPLEYAVVDKSKKTGKKKEKPEISYMDPTNLELREQSNRTKLLDETGHAVDYAHVAEPL